MHGPDLPSRSRELLAEMVGRSGGTLSFLQIPDELCAGLPIRGFTGKATWYRIFLPELLPDVNRVLSLDVDLIVVDSLEALWRTSLRDRYVAAVTNVLERHHMGRPAALGLTGPEAYFNAGAPRWRDQDALNVILGGRRLPLHPRWNYMNSMVLFPWSVEVFAPESLEQARRRPGIRHFEGPGINKPWHYLCDRDMRGLYFDHRRQTPWPDCRLEGVTPRNVLRRWLRDLRRVAARSEPASGDAAISA
jgi:lipopolysaccharide biosynthesis glycosyltransferase